MIGGHLSPRATWDTIGEGEFSHDGIAVGVIAGYHANILREPRGRLLAAPLTNATTTSHRRLAVKRHE
jgi:hypothetical protein